MLLTKLVERYRDRLTHGSPGQLLRELSRDLRSDEVPAVLRDAARSVASLLDGTGEGQAKGGAPTGVTINVTIAVAVGAPGKEQDSKSAQPAQGAPNDAVVIASAVASFPSSPAPSPSTPQSSEPAPSS